MATFNHIGGAEPSTLTFKLATVTQTRNSSAMHQEIQTIGDPDSSLALAAVLGAAPASTSFGLVVRQVGTLPTSGDSTVFQGTSPWTIAGNSTVFQGTSPWVVSATRINIGSTAADNAVSISGNSTVVQGTNPWVVSPNSTAFVKNAGFSVDSSNALNVKIDGSTRINIGSTAADNAVLISGNSTVAPLAGSLWTIQGNSTVAPLAGSTWATRPIQSSAADLQMTATPAAGSTWNVRCLQSSAADLQVTATQAGTWTFQLGTGLQSTVAPSSNSSGIIVRQVVDNILTTASTSAFAASTSLSIQSSGAGLRSYVTAYSVLTTNAGPTKIAFYSSGTMTWPLVLAAVSSAVTGANLAVSAPAYIFRTANQEALTLQTKGSTVAGWSVAVSYFRAP